MLRIIISILLLTIISSCTTGPREYFKKSANNKLFDIGGFQNEKRTPLYNPKYVSKAKKNIISGDYEDDFDEDYDIDDVDENTYHKNIQMYKEMVDNENYENPRQKRKWYQWGRSNSYEQPKSYPNLYSKKRQVNNNNSKYRNQNLRDELEEIKTMLRETQQEMENSKCPNARVIEKDHSHKNYQHDSLPDNSDYVRSL